MTLQTSAPLERLSLNVTNRELRGLVDLLIDGSLTVDAPYQRGVRWNTQQRVGLIRSILQGLPIPALVINDRMGTAWEKCSGSVPIGDAIYAVIDGKQRLQTAHLWMTNAFSVPASWFDRSRIERTRWTGDGEYVTYSDLTDVGRRFFDRQATIGVCEGRVGSVQEEAAIFRLVNGQGSPVTAEDLARAESVERS